MSRLIHKRPLPLGRHALGALTCLGLLAACGGAPAPEAPGEPPAASTATASAPSSPTPAPVAADAPGPTPDTAPAPPPSPLKVWAKFPSALGMFPLGTSHALLSGPAVDGGFSFSFLLLSASGEVTSPEGLNSQLPGFADFRTATGSWPKATFIGYITGNGRVGWSQVARATSKGWKSVNVNSPRWVDVSVQAWDKGRVLALSVDQFGFDRKPPTFRVVAGYPARPVPKLAASKVPLPKDGSPGCTSAIIPEGFAATELGHVFVTGTSCAETSKQMFVEYFAPGSTTSKTFEVEVSGENLSAVARAEDDVFLSAGGSLLHFNGSALEQVPEVKFATQLALSEQGTVWVGAGDKLYKQAKGGAWETIWMPAGAVASGLFAPDDEHVFVLGGDALYSFAAPSAGVKEFKAEFGQKPSKSISLPKAATPDCRHLYALLYGFTKVTPDDYDFPLTRKAIKGQTWLEDTRFVVTEDNGKKYFGAIPNDYEVGKRLVAHVSKKVKGSVPVLLCADPKVVRELPIDLKSGEVRK